MSCTSRYSALISINIFRQIAILASAGLNALWLADGNHDHVGRLKLIVSQIANILCAIIRNNHASSSPRFDNNSIDINIALIFLFNVGKKDFARWWINSLIAKLIFSTTKKYCYPISSDNLEDLAQLEQGNIENKGFMLKATWLVPSLAIWCVVFTMHEDYQKLIQELIVPNKDIVSQLWHPTTETYNTFYFGKGVLRQGETQVNIEFSDEMDKFKDDLLRFKSGRYDVAENSPAVKDGMHVVEFLACKHFRLPVPPTIIYALINDN